MNNIVDLHGLTEEEAIAEVLTALTSLDFSNDDEIEIITGRGMVLTRVVEELAEEEGYDWYHRNGNYGSYIIKK